MKRSMTDADDNNSFLFQVDILVSADTNGSALESLLHVLNSGDFEDFRVKSGVQLGRVIEEALLQDKKRTASKTLSAAPSPASIELEQRIQLYIKTNKLIRLNVNKGRGVKLSIPCRIVNFDAAAQNITVYHVDEKQVYNLKLFEIDDFFE